MYILAVLEFCVFCDLKHTHYFFLCFGHSMNKMANKLYFRDVAEILTNIVALCLMSMTTVIFIFIGPNISSDAAPTVEDMSSSYEGRRHKLNKDWRDIEPKLLKLDMSLHGPCSDICCICHSMTSEANIKVESMKLSFFQLD